MSHNNNPKRHREHERRTLPWLNAGRDPNDDYTIDWTMDERFSPAWEAQDYAGATATAGA
jgi:hypothetical protein